MSAVSLPVPVAIPLLNPNEPEGRLAGLHVSEGQHVSAGAPLFTLETTKSTAEVAAEADGFVAGLRMAEGQAVRAGDLFCYLAESADWQPPAGDASTSETDHRVEQPLPAGLRITQPALALARRHNLDLSRLPAGGLVTEAAVHRLLEQAQARPRYPAPAQAFDPSAIIVYGGGGHGKSIIDLLELVHVYNILGVVDDGLPAGQSVLGLRTLGGVEALAGLYAQGARLAVNAVGGIGNLQIRLKVFQNLSDAGFTCPAVVHPAAFVEASAVLASGVQVFAHAYVGSEARLGFGCIVNTGAIVSHDCVLEDYANLSPGAILAGEVHIGAGALVGMGATINLRVRVGAGARIGNGATVKEDVAENGVVRAGTIWPA